MYMRIQTIKTEEKISQYSSEKSLIWPALWLHKRKKNLCGYDNKPKLN